MVLVFHWRMSFALLGLTEVSLTLRRERENILISLVYTTAWVDLRSSVPFLSIFFFIASSRFNLKKIEATQSIPLLESIKKGSVSLFKTFEVKLVVVTFMRRTSFAGALNYTSSSCSTLRSILLYACVKSTNIWCTSPLNSQHFLSTYLLPALLEHLLHGEKIIYC